MYSIGLLVILICLRLGKKCKKGTRGEIVLIPLFSKYNVETQKRLSRDSVPSRNNKNSTKSRLLKLTIDGSPPYLENLSAKPLNSTIPLFENL